MRLRRLAAAGALAVASITVPAGGKCLDANAGATANGTRLVLWPCTGAANQRWSVPTTCERPSPPPCP